MTDDHPEQDPDLDPGDEARIRALLADLGEGPDAASMPPDVSSRLDATLAGLVAERAEVPTGSEEPAGTVVPLRRRWASRAAVAAAAVIVVGAGGVAAVNLGVFGGNDDAMKSAGGAASSTTESQHDSAPTAAPSTANGLLNQDLPQLSAARFDTQVTSLLGNPSARNELPPGPNRREAGTSSAGGDAVRGCPGPAVSDASRIRVVLYDGTPAALVVHPQRDRTRLVEAWTCTGDRRLDSASVPAGVPHSGKPDPGLATPGPSPQD